MVELVEVWTQQEECVEMGATQFGWFVETWGFHFVGKLGVSTMIEFGVSGSYETTGFYQTLSPWRHRFGWIL
jgi:hypothetical protein